LSPPNPKRELGALSLQDEARTSFGDQVIAFCHRLRAPRLADLGVEVMNPYREPEARRCTREFYTKFFSDSHRRVFIIGINPGRFGGGTTGIPFTDPVTLAAQAGISNSLPPRRELSAEFLERVVDRLDGPRRFYRSWFITAVSPLGFTKDGLNYNYYDDRRVRERLEPFIVRSMRKQLAFGARRDIAIVLGTGTNFSVFSELNRRCAFFEKLVALEHPRFIMQYRRKRVDEFAEKYERALMETTSD
jgi:hypothetical protein